MIAKPKIAAARRVSGGASLRSSSEAAQGVGGRDLELAAEGLAMRAQAILGPTFSVAVNPHSDVPSVEIDAGAGRLEYVALLDDGLIGATHWGAGPYGSYRREGRFGTLEAALEYVRRDSVPDDGDA